MALSNCFSIVFNIQFLSLPFTDNTPMINFNINSSQMFIAYDIVLDLYGRWTSAMNISRNKTFKKVLQNKHWLI